MSDARAFFDTGVLLHLLSADAARSDRVETLLEQSGVVSVQVLNEFAAVASHRLHMPADDIREVLGIVRDVCRIEALTLDDHERAIGIMDRYKLSFGDAVIIATALRAECRTLYAAELPHRRVIEHQLTVIDPFRAP